MVTILMLRAILIVQNQKGLLHDRDTNFETRKTWQEQVPHVRNKDFDTSLRIFTIRWDNVLKMLQEIE